MKNFALQTLIILLTFAFISCEEVVNVDLDTAEPRLVIDAPLVWPKGTEGRDQYITLSLTAGYYDPEVSRVTQASVSVTDEAGNTFTFVQQEVPGRYECHNFIPVINGKYFLTIFYQGERYQGEEVLYAVPGFDRTSQSEGGGINGDDVEVKAYFTDPVGVRNYYLSKKEATGRAIPEYSSFEDKFFDGNQVFDLFSDEDLSSGDRVTFTLFGISRRQQEYLVRLLNATGGNPFQPVPGVVKGNMINTTVPKHYPLGYFSISQTATITHEVE